MKKRIVSLILMMLILCTPAYALENSASEPDWNALERFASYEENGSVWSVRSNQTEAAIVRISSESAPYSGYACFGLELTGDRATGVVVPVLAFYYAGEVELNGEYASISVNGSRYDIALHKETLRLGKNAAERLTAPLNAEGLAMLHEMLNAEELAIVLYGSSSFKMEPRQEADYDSARKELAGRSLEAIEDLLYVFESMEAYELWDLNEAWWERMYGAEAEFSVVSLPTEKKVKVGGVELEQPAYMLSRGAQGNAVSDLQKLLIRTGYMQGSSDGAYGEGTVRAVRAAQKWLGLTPTGAADAKLIGLLSGAEAEAPAAAAAETAAEKQTVEGLCELTIDRHWIADAVESTGGDRRTVSDKDDKLLIYEGTVRNLSTDKLDFYWQISATVKTGEYEYPCVLVCERNEGDSLFSALPSLGEARLLIYAEVPEVAAQACEWTLEVEAEGTVFLFE